VSQLEYTYKNQFHEKANVKAVLVGDSKVISPSEYIEIFLITRGYDTSLENRLRVAESLAHVPARERHSASELDHWLDCHFKS